MTTEPSIRVHITKAAHVADFNSSCLRQAGDNHHLPPAHLPTSCPSTRSTFPVSPVNCTYLAMTLGHNIRVSLQNFKSVVLMSVYGSRYFVTSCHVACKYVQICQNTCPNTSKYVKICPNLSKYVQIHPNTSKYVQIRPNTSK